VTGIAVGALLWGVVGLDIWLAPEVQLPQAMYLLPAILFLPALEIVALFYPDEKQPAVSLGILALGIIYCYLPLYLFVDLGIPDVVSEYDFWLPFGILFLTWTLDVMSYFIGGAIGRHWLYPRISPKKTWEGAIGGAVSCFIGGMIFQYFLQPAAYSWVVISLLIGFFSQIGDLVESMFKRSVQIKDLGNILPGHGGMLDRFDGLLLSSVFIYLYFQAMEIGKFLMDKVSF
jgi:phosphatidate cytidylyltransferase